jgi:hypothetical protein
VARIPFLALCAILTLPPGLAAQQRPLPALPGGAPYPPLVLEEHADGGEGLVLAGGVSLLGLMVYDIASAPASARWHNAQRPEGPRRSPGTALLLSLAATAVPVAAGIVVFDRGQEAVGMGLVTVGVAAGPGVGHWYAGRRSRALQNAGLRSVLLLGSFYMEQCCT